MRRICERAYAKLNLTLDVLCKRPDGYHDMEMVMQTVDLQDTVDITLKDAPGIEVDISRDDLPRGLHNLAGKAAEAFLDYVNLSVGISVYITKNIPDRAGMAGGSADAAAVIRGLDRVLETRLSERELLDLCAKVGSDVPFCLFGGTALATGRGELLTDLPALPKCGIAIVKPDFSVSTPALFGAIDGQKITRRPDTAAFLELLKAGDLPGMGAALYNVFEPVLPPSERETVNEIKSHLLQNGALGACMTGTGSVVFGLFPSLEAAKRMAPLPYATFFASPVGKIV